MSRRNDFIRQIALIAALALSGFSALSYEMAWVRQLVSFLGVTYFAITTILTTFMAGLALGAAVAGRLVDRWRVPPLLAFAGLELFLAVYGQLFHPLSVLVDSLYIEVVEGADLSFGLHALLRMVFAAAVLLPPALVSGATLPVAAKGFVARDEAIGGDLGRLYGANVLGATLGGFATTFLLIGLLGYPATAWWGSGANLAAALLALAVVALGGVAHSAPTPESAPVAWLPDAKAVAAVYFAIGFASIGGELLWTRVLSQAGFNPATLVFGLVLTTYLIGHGLGALLLYPFAVRRWEARPLFVALVLVFALSLALSVGGMAIRSAAYTPVGPMRTIGLVLPWERVLLLVPGVLLPAACTGALMPLAAQLGIPGTVRVGTGVGSLSALSTVGGILGSLLTGVWLMPALGAVPCLVLMAGVCGVAVIWAYRALVWPGWSLRRATTWTAAMVAATVLLVAVTPEHLHLLLFPGERVVAFQEGRNASTAVVDVGLDVPFLLVSGERVFGGGSDVDLATALHPDARTIAVIGLGTGTVTADALAAPQFRTVTAVDIDGDLPRLLPLMHRDRWDLFESSRFEFVENDGRHFLRTEPRQFDIIINDAAIYAWYLELSTLELNQLAATRLSDEGLYIGRLHLNRITDEAYRREIRTFLEVFPNAAMWRLGADIVMLVGRKGWQSTVGAPGGHLFTSRRPLLYGPTELQAIAEGAALITDDHPLHVPRTFMRHDVEPIIEYTAPADLPSPGRSR